MKQIQKFDFPPKVYRFVAEGRNSIFPDTVLLFEPRIVTILLYESFQFAEARQAERQRKINDFKGKNPNFLKIFEFFIFSKFCVNLIPG